MKVFIIGPGEPEMWLERAATEQIDNLNEIKPDLAVQSFPFILPEKIEEIFIPKRKHMPKGHQRPYRFHP